jgi:hypothetical protein
MPVVSEGKVDKFLQALKVSEMQDQNQFSA